MKLLALITALEKERDRLTATGLNPDAEVDLAVELPARGGYAGPVAPLRQVSRVGAAVRLTGRPS